MQENKGGCFFWTQCTFLHCICQFRRLANSVMYPPSCPTSICEKVHMSDGSVTLKTWINASQTSNTYNAKIPSVVGGWGSGVRAKSRSFDNEPSDKWTPGQVDPWTTHSYRLNILLSTGLNSMWIWCVDQSQYKQHYYNLPLRFIVVTVIGLQKKHFAE